jgi:hypothetical protein
MTPNFENSARKPELLVAFLGVFTMDGGEVSLFR